MIPRRRPPFTPLDEDIMPIAILWIQLGVAAAVILGASVFLAKSADVIAIKTGLGRSFVGVVMLATATSLPELVTGVSSVALVGEPDLAVGGAFGSNLFNLLIIGLMDIFWRNRYLLNHVGTSPVVVGALGTGIIALGGVAVLLHHMTTILDAWIVSPLSIVLIVSFAAAMYFIYLFERKQNSDDDRTASEEPGKYASESLPKHVAIYTLTALAVVGAAVWLSFVSDEVAVKMGWNASFMGTQFLAAATSLPELATSFAALRIAAPELAITNLLGSNLFNMGFVLFLNDVAHTGGPIWTAVSQVHALTGLIAIAMTTVIVLAVMIRPGNKQAGFVTIEAGALISVYAIASLLVFTIN